MDSPSGQVASTTTGPTSDPTGQAGTIAGIVNIFQNDNRHLTNATVHRLLQLLVAIQADHTTICIPMAQDGYAAIPDLATLFQAGGFDEYKIVVLILTPDANPSTIVTAAITIATQTILTCGVALASEAIRQAMQSRPTFALDNPTTTAPALPNNNTLTHLFFSLIIHANLFFSFPAVPSNNQNVSQNQHAYLYHRLLSAIAASSSLLTAMPQHLVEVDDTWVPPPWEDVASISHPPTEAGSLLQAFESLGHFDDYVQQVRRWDVASLSDGIRFYSGLYLEVVRAQAWMDEAALLVRRLISSTKRERARLGAEMERLVAKYGEVYAEVVAKMEDVRPSAGTGCADQMCGEEPEMERLRARLTARIEMVDGALKALKRLEVGHVGVRLRRVGRAYRAQVDRRRVALAGIVVSDDRGRGETAE